MAESEATSAGEPGAVESNAEAPAAVLSQMNLANTVEIQLSSLAARRAASPQIKRLARKLANDHTRNREQVRALAQKVNVPLTPTPAGSPSAADTSAIPRDLQERSGAEFDRAFVRHEINQHQWNIEKIQNQVLPSVPDEQIRTHLRTTVTEMQGHLANLQKAQQQLGN